MMRGFADACSTTAAQDDLEAAAQHGMDMADIRYDLLRGIKTASLISVLRPVIWR
jgi:hypothetical protein